MPVPFKTPWGERVLIDESRAGEASAQGYQRVDPAQDAMEMARAKEAAKYDAPGSTFAMGLVSGALPFGAGEKLLDATGVVPLAEQKKYYKYNPNARLLGEASSFLIPWGGAGLVTKGTMRVAKAIKGGAGAAKFGRTVAAGAVTGAMEGAYSSLDRYVSDITVGNVDFSAEQALSKTLAGGGVGFMFGGALGTVGASAEAVVSRVLNSKTAKLVKAVEGADEKLAEMGSKLSGMADEIDGVIGNSVSKADELNPIYQMAKTSGADPDVFMKASGQIDEVAEALEKFIVSERGVPEPLKKKAIRAIKELKEILPYSVGPSIPKSPREFSKLKPEFNRRKPVFDSVKPEFNISSYDKSFVDWKAAKKSYEKRLSSWEKAKSKFESKLDDWEKAKGSYEKKLARWQSAKEQSEELLKEYGKARYAAETFVPQRGKFKSVDSAYRSVGRAAELAEEFLGHSSAFDEIAEATKYALDDASLWGTAVNDIARAKGALEPVPGLTEFLKTFADPKKAKRFIERADPAERDMVLGFLRNIEDGTRRLDDVLGTSEAGKVKKIAKEFIESMSNGDGLMENVKKYRQIAGSGGIFPYVPFMPGMGGVGVSALQGLRGINFVTSGGKKLAAVEAFVNFHKKHEQALLSMKTKFSKGSSPMNVMASLQHGNLLEAAKSKDPKQIALAAQQQAIGADRMIPDDAPGMKLATGEAAQRLSSALLRGAPIQEPENPFLPAPELTKGELALYMKRLDALKSPVDTFTKAIMDGDLNYAGIDAIREAFPAIYADAETKILDSMLGLAVRGKRASFKHRTRAGLIFGHKTDGMLDAKLYDMMRQYYGASREKEQQKKSKGKDPKLSSAYYYETGSQGTERGEGR